MRQARLFLFGSEATRGDWRKAGEEAGFTGRSPAVGSATSQAALTVAREGMEAATATTDADLLDLQRLMAEGSQDWASLAPVARKVLAKIATGTLAPKSTQQVIALKEILARAEGRAGEGRKEEVELGVIILPVITEKGVLMVDLAEMQEDAEELPE